jgi:hypothetical protein
MASLGRIYQYRSKDSPYSHGYLLPKLETIIAGRKWPDRARLENPGVGISPPLSHNGPSVAASKALAYYRHKKRKPFASHQFCVRHHG